MPPGSRGRTPSVEVRGALLRAAREILDERGPEALSVREIATRAGTATMGVYKRFGSKNGILDALLVDGFTELATAVEPGAHDEPDQLPGGSGFSPVDSLARGMHRYRAFALENRTMYHLMFDWPVPELVPSPEALAAARAAFSPLVAAVSIGIVSGDFRSGDATDTAQQVWAACHGAVSLELRGISFVTDPAAHYDALVATLIRGIGP